MTQKVRATPLAKRVAAALNVDLATLTGTSPRGLITREDVERKAGVQSASPSVASEALRAAAAPAASAPSPATSPAGPATSPAAPAAAPPPGGALPLPANVKPREVMAPTGPVVTGPEAAKYGPGVEVRKMTPMRGKIAEHMVDSKRVSAHVNTFWDVDMHRVSAHRNKAKNKFKERYGSSLTYMAYIARAVAAALPGHPLVNCSVDGSNIILHRHVNLGIAVALDNGLIVPVIPRAEELNALGLSLAIADKAERARTRRLKPDEVQHGTFSITNVGSFGNTVGMPIINQPQVAILAVGAVKTRVVALNSTDIARRDVMSMSLSFDHRVVDGMAADLFMRDVRDTLEDWNELIL